MLTILSLDARRSSAATREIFARTLGRPVPGAPIPLVTCNRVELIGWGDGSHLIGSPPLPSPLARRFLAEATTYCGEAAAAHLLRVAAGLESQIEGDVQVLGQVRTAYAAAAQAGALDAGLHRLFQTALRAGKRVHTETVLGRRDASVGAAAAEVVVSRLTQRGDDGLRLPLWVAVVGAGTAAERAARALTAGGCIVTILNRDRDRAEQLARRVGADVAPFEARHRIGAAADAALCITGATTPILLDSPLRTERERAGRAAAPLLVVDLAMPRNVAAAVGRIPGVTLLGLQQIPGAPLAGPAVRDAERILDDELRGLCAWLRSRAVPVG